MPASEDRQNRRLRRTQMQLLSRSVRSIRGVGPRIAELLGRMNLFTIEDMLYFLPRQYEDRREICRIPDTVPGVRQTISGKIMHADIRFYGRKRIFEVTIDDGYGVLKVKVVQRTRGFLKGHFQDREACHSHRRSDGISLRKGYDPSRF